MDFLSYHQKLFDMCALHNPLRIYEDIINNKISLEKGINILINLLIANNKEDIKIDCERILNKLTEKQHEILGVFQKILKSSQNSSIKLLISKEIFTKFLAKSIDLLKNEIQKEKSASFLLSFYKFLEDKKSNSSETLKNSIIKKYGKLYEIDKKEAEFFIELEATQINNLIDLDFTAGYFKKFRAVSLVDLKSNSNLCYLTRERHLIALDLSRWEFKEIPESIGFLLQLQYLSLANLGMKTLPESIKHLSKLQYLNLSGNRLTLIPSWLIDLVKNKFCKKYNNEGVNPTEAITLSVLEILSGNKLEKVETKNQVVQWDVALNYKLNFKGNVIGIYINDEKIEIGILPEEICNLKDLEELDLPGSSIEHIPDCIGEMKFLRYLNLNSNRIKAVPESIIKLKNLEYLDLENNDISEKALLTLTWFKTGQKCLEKHEYDKVIDECTSTLEVYPKNLFALFHLGIAYKEMGKIQESEDIFKRFLNVTHSNAIVWSYLVDIYHQKGDYEKAIDAVKNAIKIEPNNAILWSNLGFNYKKLGKYDKAIEAYSHSLEINPMNKNIWRDLASIYRDRGDYMKAIDAEERAIELEFKSNSNK